MQNDPQPQPGQQNNNNSKETNGIITGITGYTYYEEFLDHLLYQHHPESPQRLIKIQEMMKQTGLEKQITPLLAASDPLDAILNIHTKSHTDSVLETTTTGEVAKLAVGSALGAVDAVSQGKVKNAFCALRPPGHHANNNGANHDGSGQGEGFCFFGNAAIAARYAQKAHGHKKILIVDWDYHHGNGTENAFYDDPSVLFFSTHNWNDYPGTGNPARQGEGDGLGYNINLHFDPGSGDDIFRKAFDERLIPAVEKFKPDFIIISAGFDSRENDILGSFEVTDTGFSHLTRTVMDLADQYCGGRIVSLLEGGYNVEGLALAVEHHIKSLLGEKTSSIKH